MVEGTPPGDALPPPPKRATPARKGARCGDGAGSPRLHRPHPGHRVPEPWLAAPEDGRPGEGQRLTPGAPQKGGRHPPRGCPSATPTRATPARGGARCGTVAGSPHPHRPHPGHTGRGTLAARSRGRAAWGETAPDTRRTTQRWQAPPPRDALPPPPQRATAARKGARCGTGARSPGPH